MQCVRSHWPTEIIIFWGPQPMCTEHADGMFVGPSQSSYFTSNMYYTTNSGKGWILNLIQGTGIFYPQDVWYRKQCWPVKHQPYKMVKQTIRRLLPTNCVSVFDHSCGLVLKVLSVNFIFSFRKLMILTL